MHPLRAIPRWQWLSALVLLCWVALGMTLIQAPQPDRLPPDPAPPQLAALPPTPGLDALPVLILPKLPETDAEQAPLQVQAGHWVDHTRQAGLAQAREQAIAGAFTLVPELHSTGVSRAAHWYAVRIRQPHDAPALTQPWLLLAGAAFIDDMRVWVEHADGRLRSLQLGDHFLDAQRPVRARMHVTPFSIAPGEEVRLWVRAQTSGVMSVSLSLTPPSAFFTHEARTLSLLGMLLGVLSLAFIIYLLLGLWLRDRIMLAYALLVLTQWLTFAGNTGMLMQLVQQLPWWLSDLVNGVGAVGPLCAAVLLWIYILDLPRRYPRLAKLYAGVALLVLALLPLTMTEHYRLLLGVAYQAGLWFGPINLVLAWLAWRRLRDRLRLIYLAAFIVFEIGISTTVLAVFGALPANELTLNAYPISSILHTLLMAVAMALRIAQLHHDKRLVEGRMQDHRRFVALLTHEFRNPLSSIDRSANFLQAAGTPMAEPMQARIVNIRRQARRLNDLVTGFLRVGDPQEGKLPTQLLATDVGKLCQTLHGALGPDERQRVQLTLAPGHYTARLDPILMQLALNNLLDNALRYSPVDGRVELTLSPAADKQVDIIITDSGPGLGEADLAQLGTPYYRGSASPGTQGTGLGYYFSRRIITTHGGKLIAQAAPTQGLQVIVRLPLSPD